MVLDRSIPFALSPSSPLALSLSKAGAGSGQILPRAPFRQVSDLLMKRLKAIIASLYGANKACKRLKPDLKSGFGSNPIGPTSGGTREH